MSERKDNRVTDEDFAGKAKQVFDESVMRLDGQTRSRLNRSRQAALAELSRGSGVAAWSRWVPGVGVAAAAVVVVVLWSGNRPVEELTPPELASDFEILLTEDSFEMLEDLEFYTWIELDENEQALETDENVG